MTIRGLTLALAAFLLLLQRAEADQLQFSWKAVIGTSSTQLSEQLKGLASCTNPQPLHYQISSPLTRVTLEDFNGWTSPTRGGTGFVLAEEFSSGAIETRTCKFDDAATAVAMSYQNRIFSILLSYHRCDAFGNDCNFNPTKLDNQAYDFARRGVAIVPALGVGTISDDELERFLEVQEGFSGTAIARNFFFDASDCFFPGLNQLSFHCLVSVESAGGVTQSFSFVEIQSEVSGANTAPTLLTRRSLTDMRLQEEAVHAFIDEVNGEVERLSAQARAIDEEQLRVKSVLESLE